MYPHGRSLVERMKGKPFTILGINSDGAKECKQAIEEEKLTWPSIWDGGAPSGPVAISWGVESWPSYFLIDTKGVIRYTQLKMAEIDAAVDFLVAELEEQ